MNKSLLSFILCGTLLLPLPAMAYGKRRIGGTSAMTRTATTGIFVDRQVWLPQNWAVTQEPESLTFTKPSADGAHKSIVHLEMIPREQCAYGIARIRALKAWGGSNLEQQQGRIQPISFGTSRFRGYTWVEPSTWEGDQHWCIAQDLKNALELTAPVGDHDLITFINNDLLLQLVVRSGRSVLPWPSASEHSSSSTSSAPGVGM